MSTDIHHLGSEYSYGAVHGRIGLVECCHQTANRRLLFHEINLVSRISEIQRSLDSGNASADYKRTFGDRNNFFILRFKVPRTRDRCCDKVLCLFSRCILFILMDPRAMLSQVSHREKVWIQSSLSNTLLERGFMNLWRATRHDNAIKVMFPDRSLDFILARIGAGVLVLDNSDDISQPSCVGADSVTVNGPGDIQSAFANKYSDSQFVSQTATSQSPIGDSKFDLS
jgi:hypothetical protein